MKNRFLSIITLSLILTLPNYRSTKAAPIGLPATNVSKSGNVYSIDGGSSTQTNLFYNFSSFSLLKNETALFNASPSIKNIIAKVLGSASFIDGLLLSNNGANFILVNPSGITFGPNSKLSISGSFLATTASRLQFDASGNLIALGFNGSEGGITLQGSNTPILIYNSLPSPVTIINNNVSELTGSYNHTLAFVGNGFTCIACTINGAGASIEIGSVNQGSVGINYIPSGLSLDYSKALRFSDINLSNQSTVYSNGPLTGNTHLQGQNINVLDGSAVFLQNFGPSKSDITLNASKTVTLDGTSFAGTNPSSLINITLGPGEGGSINVYATQVNISDGAALNTKTFGPANAGDINLFANNVSINGFSVAYPIFISGIGSYSLSSGATGNVNLLVNTLTATNGGSVATGAFGSGNGGNIYFTGATLNLSGITNDLTPSQLSAITFGLASAGSVIINTHDLYLSGGGSVFSLSLASGNAGDVTVNAEGSIRLSSVSLTNAPVNPLQSFPTFQSQISQFIGANILGIGTISSAALRLPPPVAQLFNIDSSLTGNSGNVFITTPLAILQDHAAITVINQGTGKGGNLSFFSNNAILENSSLSAQSNGGPGGNIKIVTTGGALKNSVISTSAIGISNGGNISIQAKALLGTTNSSILANAQYAAGGNIFLNTEELQFPGTISASSDLGANYAGRVAINSNTNTSIQPKKATYPKIYFSTISNCNAKSNSEISVKSGSGKVPDTNELLDTATEQIAIPNQYYEDIYTNEKIPVSGNMIDWKISKDGIAHALDENDVAKNTDRIQDVRGCININFTSAKR